MGQVDVSSPSPSNMSDERSLDEENCRHSRTNSDLHRPSEAPSSQHEKADVREACNRELPAQLWYLAPPGQKGSSKTLSSLLNL